MATSVTLNGTSYSVPATGGDSWGPSLSSYLIALSTGVLSKSGGAFTLTAEADFGATYGLKAAYFKSRGTVSTTGIIRLANTETASWRNAANSGDLALTVNASDKLTYNSVELATISTAQTLTTKTISGSSNFISDIGYGSLDLTGSIVNTDVSASAAIAYSKLNLAGSVDLTSDVTGTLPIANGGSGQTTKLAAFDALSPTTTKGDLIVSNGTNNIRQAAGTDGYAITYNSANASGLGSAAILTNPMDSAGDLIVGGASGVLSKLDHPGASGYVLASTGASTTAWTATPAFTSFTVGGGSSFGNYVESTWTPAESSKTNLTGTGSYGTSTYTRIGRLVFASISSITGYSVTTGSGTRTLLTFTSTGLPSVANSTVFFGSSKITISGSDDLLVPVVDNSTGNTLISVVFRPSGSGSIGFSSLQFWYYI